MAPNAIKYINSQIYQIYSVDPKITDCYIGHTTSIVKRRAHHKKETNKGIKQDVLYRFIRENGGWGNFQMCKVLDCPSINRSQVLEALSYVMTSGDYNCTLNMTTMPGTVTEKVDEVPDEVPIQIPV